MSPFLNCERLTIYDEIGAVTFDRHFGGLGRDGRVDDRACRNDRWHDVRHRLGRPQIRRVEVGTRKPEEDAVQG
jgi:hypothetical protein